MDQEHIRNKRGWFEGVKSGVRRGNRLIAAVGGCFLIPLMILTTGDVVGRDLLNHPVPGTVELSQYMLAVFILLGLAYAQQVKAHVGVSLVTSRLPQQVQHILSILATLLCLFVSFILVWQGWMTGIEEKAVSDILRIPQAAFRLMIALAGFLMCLELMIDLADALLKPRRKAS